MLLWYYLHYIYLFRSTPFVHVCTYTNTKTFYVANTTLFMNMYDVHICAIYNVVVLCAILCIYIMYIYLVMYIFDAWVVGGGRMRWCCQRHPRSLAIYIHIYTYTCVYILSANSSICLYVCTCVCMCQCVLQRHNEYLKKVIRSF